MTINYVIKITFDWTLEVLLWLGCPILRLNRGSLTYLSIFPPACICGDLYIMFYLKSIIHCVKYRCFHIISSYT